MANEEPIVIKLSAEQLMAKQVSVEQVQEQIEHQELNVTQLERDIGNNFFLRQAQVLLNGEKAKLAQLKHNLIALKIQVEKGEM